MLTISTVSELSSILNNYTKEIGLEQVDVGYLHKDFITVLLNDDPNKGFTASEDGITSGPQIITTLSSATKDSKVKVMGIARFNQFIKWCVEHQCNIDYLKICENSMKEIISPMSFTFPRHSLMLRGLEIYPIKQNVGTLCVSRYSRYGQDRVCLQYNPRFVVDTVISDVLIGKYSTRNMITGISYMFIHELSHLVKSQLTDWSQSTAEGMDHQSVNIMEDVGINAHISSILNLPTIDDGFGAGTYFTYSVQQPDVVTNLISKMISTYARTIFKFKTVNILSYLSSMAVGDKLKVIIGVTDTSEVMATLSRLLKVGAIVEISNSANDKIDQLQKQKDENDKKDQPPDEPEPDPPIFDLNDIVLDPQSMYVYVVVTIVGKGVVEGKELGRLTDAKFLSELNLRSSSIFIADILKSSSVRSRKLDTREIVLVDIKKLTLDQVFQSGDVVYHKVTKETKMVLGIDVDGNVQFAPPLPDMPLTPTSAGRLISRVIYSSGPPAIPNPLPRSTPPTNLATASIIPNESVSDVSNVVDYSPVESVDDTVDYKSLAQTILSKNF